MLRFGFSAWLRRYMNGADKIPKSFKITFGVGKNLICGELISIRKHMAELDASWMDENRDANDPIVAMHRLEQQSGESPHDEEKYEDISIEDEDWKDPDEDDLVVVDKAMIIHPSGEITHATWIYVRLSSIDFWHPGYPNHEPLPEEPGNGYG